MQKNLSINMLFVKKKPIMFNFDAFISPVFVFLLFVFFKAPYVRNTPVRLRFFEADGALHIYCSVDRGSFADHKVHGWTPTLSTIH